MNNYINIDEESQNLFENGFIHIKNFFQPDEIDLISNAINLNMKNPSPFARKTMTDNTIDFFFDYNNYYYIKKSNCNYLD